MSRCCMITGKRVMKGNNVSHAMNKTRRDFLPNVQDARVFSEILSRWIKIRVSASGLRTLDKKGGIDAFLKATPVTKLDSHLRPYKKQIEKALTESAAA